MHPQPDVSLLAQAEIARRRLSRATIEAFFLSREPDYRLGAWLVDLFRNLEWARDTPGAKLLIFAPPRHGKSTVVSRILPAFLLGQNPRDEVLAASASQDLADEFGLYVRNTLNDPLYQELFPRTVLDPGSNSVSRVALKAGGGYRAVGIGGQIVGRGATWLIVDDPYKDRAQAYSANERAKIETWYRTAARTRLSPGGRLIIMHQRWHHEDLAATLLAKAKATPTADQWRVLSYPAYAEADDHLRRPVGAPLFPEFWPASELELHRANMLEEEWLALYQQRPTKLEGGFFKADWFQFYDQIPEKVHWYIGVDFAASTAAHADRTAIFPVAIDSQHNLYVAPDFVLDRLESLDSASRLLDLAKKYKPLAIATEKGVLDRVMRPILNLQMRERQIYTSFTEVTRTAAKYIVAAPLQARMQQRRVWFPNNQRMREQVIPAFLNFMPAADNSDDDAIDALANVCQGLDQMVGPAPPPTLPELTEAELEEAQWQKIQSRRPPVRTGITRLNGEPYAKRTT